MLKVIDVDNGCGWASGLEMDDEVELGTATVPEDVEHPLTLIMRGELDEHVEDDEVFSSLLIASWSSRFLTRITRERNEFKWASIFSFELAALIDSADEESAGDAGDSDDSDVCWL